MAQRGFQMDEEKLCCAICLDILKDPVTVPCGHNYCKNCIKRHWDGEDQKHIHSCPQCRQTFRQRPALVRNTMLAELVEELKKTGLQPAPGDHSYAGPGDLACDFCTGRKLKAIKSCLQCLVSYCEEHLRPHHESPAFKKHNLVEPSEKLQENMCSLHSEEMKIFCCTDQQFICILCFLDEHKDHNTVSAAAARTEKQKELKLCREKIQQRIQNREKYMKLVPQELEAINQSADKVVRDSEKIFNEMILLIKKRSSDIKQQIRSQQEAEVNRAKELLQKLEEELTELKRKDAELEQLSHTENHNQFLHMFPFLSNVSDSTDIPCPTPRPLLYFEDVPAAVSEVKDKLQDILQEGWHKISRTVTDVDVLLPQPEPKTRAEFLKFSSQLTLDPNTVNMRLLLSEGNRRVTFVSKKQGYADHPERFMNRSQVLSRESLTGRHYWEVEWSGFGIYIAVAYKSIMRTGDDSEFGNSDKSWALESWSGHCEYSHNKCCTSFSSPQSSKIGVYLDHIAGILSFYSISETITLLHKVKTKFSEPLYAGLRANHFLGSKSSAVFCELDQAEAATK